MSGRRSNGFMLLGACALLSACTGEREVATDGVAKQSSDLMLASLPTTAATATIAKGATTAPLAATAPVAVVQVPPNLAFELKSQLGRCVDFGTAPTSGASVVLRDCTRGASQQIIVQEINSRHDVVLHAGSKVLGVHIAQVSALPSTVTAATATATISTGLTTSSTSSGTTTTTPAFVSPAALSGTVTVSATATFTVDPAPPPLAPGEISLVLQDQTVAANGDQQVFSFDGDSLLLASNRDMAVRVADGRGTSGTPLVVGPRAVADDELWTFTALDGTGRHPTSAFVPASATTFFSLVSTAPPGTVIEVDPSASIRIDSTIFVPPGVTIRGGRRGLALGAELWTGGGAPNGLLDVRDRDIRITGLRFRGPSASTDDDGVDAKAIVAHMAAGNLIVDRSELSQWTTCAVCGQEDGAPSVNDCNLTEVDRPLDLRVIRNYIHNNEMQNAGYGVATNASSNAWVLGNTFIANRHAIKSGGEAHAQYRAWYNLVLSYAPQQTQYVLGTWYTQDFDVHGMGDNGFGGRGGQYFEIAGNTFLATNRQNFDLRGESCQPVDFRGNVSLQSLDDAIGCTECGAGVINVYGTQQFEHANPTWRLGVGDFDGDGRQDLFLATGAAWYYSASGTTEWRFLNSRSEDIANLRFGDFDGDGRTDVFSVRGTDWVVSWGGVSGWEVINSSSAPLADLAVADFVDDKRADVFYADGQTWWVSSSGRAPFKLRDTSSFRVSALRFGDFDGDAKTDILGLANGDISVTYAGTINWQPLWPGAASGRDIANLQVADFNGDGRADIISAFRDSSLSPQWSYYITYTGGGDASTVLHTTVPLSAVPAIGAFDAKPGADLLLWNLDAISDPTSGIGPPAVRGFEPSILEWLLISSNGTGYWQRFGGENMR